MADQMSSKLPPPAASPLRLSNNYYSKEYKRIHLLNRFNSLCFSNVLELKWDHFVNEETQEVWVHIPGGYPTTIALPHVIRRTFPGYTGHLCTKEFLQSLKDQ